jgi:glutathione S-transferase
VKLHTSVGPNPRVVNMFLAEKGLEIPKTEVDLRGAENRQAPYLKVNPAGTTPALELADGSSIAEITAICEYIDEKHPDPPLIGTTPEERAVTRMWARRMDIKVCEPLTNGFRFGEGLGMFSSRMRCLPEASPGLKAVAQDGLAWLEDNFKGPWLTGDRFTLADVLLFCFVDFGAKVGQAVNPEHAKVADWYERVKARPSAVATA